MTNRVQIFKSTDASAPTLTGQTGSLITLLNKCLVDGYSTASVTSITRSGSTVTATLGSANTTLVTGDFVTIAGAVETDYNGDYQITVTDSTHFTYSIATTPTTPATGTITYAKAGLQWTKPFAAGTNAQTYRSADAGSNQFYLQVIDNGATGGGAKEAQVYGAEVMTADQTVSSGRFPTSAQASSGLCLRKSASANSTARDWTLIGDDRTFYLITNTGDGSGVQMHGLGFGHFISHKSGDGYNTFIAASSSFNLSSSNNCGFLGAGGLGSSVSGGFYIARSYSQVGSAISVAMSALVSTSTAIVAVGSGAAAGALITYPHPVDTGFYCAPLFITDSSTTQLRGRMPGIFAPLHNNPLSNYDLVTSVVGLSGKTLTCLKADYFSTAGELLADTFGAWD